jgi:hypothetical protein
VARLYLDHDVSLALAPLLRLVGHEARTAQELGLAQATDDEQLLTAAQQGRIFLTHNRKDYVLLNDAWSRWPRAWGVPAPAHAGILVLDHRPEPELATAVDAFLTTTPAVPLASALYWWRYRAGWHRQLADRRWVPYP